MQNFNFNSLRLTEARKVNALTMVALADKLGITRQSISLFEKGIKKPSFETLMNISRTLGFDHRFFLKIPPVISERIGPTNYRSFSSATLKQREKMDVKEDWLVHIRHFYETYVDFQPVNLPALNIENFESLDDEDIEDIASTVRRYFNLNDGPISNLTLLLENSGILLAYFPMPKTLDASSSWRGDTPVILNSSNISMARQRFNSAHELGHLIMHRAVSDDDLKDKECFKLIESQAHYFSGAFLMPAKTFTEEFVSTSFAALIVLKKRWGVSIAAIIIRAFNLGLINENQKSYLFRQISINKWRLKEPLDDELKNESPKVMSKLFDFLNEKNICNADSLFENLLIPKNNLSELMGVSIDKLTPNESIDSTVIQFKLK